MMKPALAVISGFLVSSAVFISGAAVATYLIMTEPLEGPEISRDANALWSQKAGAAEAKAGEVRHVSPGSDRDTADARIEEEETRSETMASAGPRVEDVDVVSTSSISTTDGAESEQASGPGARLPAAHVEWCYSKYRSYRPETNSYTAYSGEVRSCVSPYSTAATPASNDVGERRYATTEMTTLSDTHVQDCLSRYRSYRPEDNTYQPYGGGPRRQCR